MVRNWRVWRPVAIGLAVLNVGAAGFHLALEQGEVMAIHLLLAAGAGWWAARGGRNQAAALPSPDADERMELLESELMHQRHPSLRRVEHRLAEHVPGIDHADHPRATPPLAAAARPG